MGTGNMWGSVTLEDVLNAIYIADSWPYRSSSHSAESECPYKSNSKLITSYEVDGVQYEVYDR